MKRICFVLSSHGFGHMARNLPIIQALLSKEKIELLIICAEKQIAWAKENLTPQQLSKVEFIVEQTDIGLMVKKNSLEVDIPLLQEACLAYLSDLPKLSQMYAEIFMKHHIQLVITDISPLGILASQFASIPNVLIGNFTWVELYKEWLSDEIVHIYDEIYRQVNLNISYTLHTSEFINYGENIYSASLVARPVNLLEVERIRDQFTKPIIFISAGMSVKLDFVDRVDDLPYQFITTQQVSILGKNVVKLPISISNTQDYIAASDYVITKAGWGTVAEALLSSKKIALFARDNVYEDRNTIQQLVSDNLAVKVEENDLANIPQLIEKMDLLSQVNVNKYYNSVDEICEKLISLI